MMLLEGKTTADEILLRVKEEVLDCEKIPGFGAILIGEDPASRMYVGLKKKAAQKCGMLFCDYTLPGNATNEQVLEIVEFLNKDPEIHGILIQLPLPKHLNKEMILNAIEPKKDVDGLTERNKECSREDGECFVCPFPRAILALLEKSGISLERKQAVILANSEGFGLVMTTMLRQKGIDAQYILSQKRDESRELILRADIVISAVGRANFIVADMIKDKAVVIDGGIEKQDEEVYGDVTFSGFADRDVMLTPVPGGVGPVTVACLIENVLLAAKRNGICENAEEDNRNI